MAEKDYEELLVRIGLKLSELRKKKGYPSYEAFALDHDLPRFQYWRLEKGKANFTFKSLIKILSIHGLTLEAFLSGNIIPSDTDQDGAL